MKILSTSDRGFPSVLKRITGRSQFQSGGVEKVVKTILKAVERGGDAALIRYTKKFDRVANPTSGAIELAPLVGLADRIVDLVSTGKTLKANRLIELEVIAHSTARLIVNRASLKMKHQAVTDLTT